MESYQDSKPYLIWVGIGYLALCGVFYLSSVSADAAHPARNTLLFALGVLLLCGAASALSALFLVPLIKWMMKRGRDR